MGIGRRRKGEEKEEVECDGCGFGELTHPWRHDLGWLSGEWGGGGDGSAAEYHHFPSSTEEMKETSRSFTVLTVLDRRRAGAQPFPNIEDLWLQIRCGRLNHIMFHRGNT